MICILCSLSFASRLAEHRHRIPPRVGLSPLFVGPAASYRSRCFSGQALPSSGTSGRSICCSPRVHPRPRGVRLFRLRPVIAFAWVSSRAGGSTVPLSTPDGSSPLRGRGPRAAALDCVAGSIPVRGVGSVTRRVTGSGGRVHPRAAGASRCVQLTHNKVRFHPRVCGDRGARAAPSHSPASRGRFIRVGRGATARTWTGLSRWSGPRWTPKPGQYDQLDILAVMTSAAL